MVKSKDEKLAEQAAQVIIIKFSKNYVTPSGRYTTELKSLCFLELKCLLPQAAASFTSIQQELHALQAENKRLLKDMSTLEQQRDSLKDKSLEFDKQRQLVS